VSIVKTEEARIPYLQCGGVGVNRAL